MEYRSIQTNVASALCLGAAIVLLLMSISQLISLVVSALLPTAIVFLYRMGSEHFDDSIREYDAGTVKETGVLKSIVPTGFLLGVFFISIANGYLRGFNVFGEIQGSVLVFSTVCVCCVLIPYIKTLKSVYFISILSVALGLCAMYAPDFSIGSLLIGFGQIGISIISWVVGVALAKKHNLRPSIIGGLIWAILTMGQLLGVTLGVLSEVEVIVNSPFSNFVPQIIAVPVLLVLAFTINKPFLSLVYSEESDAMEQSAYADRVQQTIKKHVLTAREAEVFSLLAYGRNAKLIESRLQISPNTVKTHIRNIHNKLGVCTQQEMLSLIETIELPKD
jgi:DNA-binding CsgD family transcriptional regulator